MPIIPRGQQNVRMNVSSPVPVASAGQARVAGESLEAFGGAVMKFANDQINADRRIKYDEGTNEIRNVVPAAHEHARNNAKPDGSDYQQKYQEFAQPRINEIRNKYGTDDLTMQRLDSFVKMVDSDQMTTTAIKAGEMREQNNYSRIDGLQNDSANRLRENPNANLLSAELISHNQLIDDLVKEGGIPADNASKLKKAFYSKSASQLIQGLEDKQQYGKALSLLQANQEDPNLKTAMPPDQAYKLGFIDSREAQMLQDSGKNYEIPVMTKGDKVRLTPEMTLVLSGMEPSQKAQWIDRMRAKIKEKTEVRLSDLNAQMSGFERVALSGAPVDDAQVAELKKQINLNPNLTPFARVRAMDSINTAYAVNKQLQLVASTPRSQWGEVLNGADKAIELAAADAAKLDPKMAAAGNDFAVQANRMQAKDALQRSLELMRKTQDADAALFVAQSDSEIQNLYRGMRDGDPAGTRNYINNSLAKQQFLGIPQEKQRLLPKADAAAVATMLAAAPDATEANEQLKQLQVQYGEHFPRLMNELSAANKDLADYKAVAYASPQTRESLIDALKNEQTIKKNITGNEALTVKSKMITNHAASYMSSFKNTLLGGTNDSGSLEVVNSLQKMVVLQAQRDLVKNPDIDTEQSVQKAYNDIIGSQFDIASGGRSTVLVPRVVGDRHMDTKIVRTYMDVYSKPENMKDLNIAIPKSMAENPDKFVQDVSTSARWVTNNTQTGIRLMQVLPDGKLQPIYDKFQRPIEKSYDDINLRPGKKVIEANKGIFKKLFGD